MSFIGSRQEQEKFERNLRKHDSSISAILREKGLDMKALTEFTIHNLKKETLVCA